MDQQVSGGPGGAHEFRGDGLEKKKDRIALGTSRQLLSVLVGLGWDGDLMKKTKRLNEDQGVFAVDSIF